MTWKDVLNSENPYQYLKFQPHFHLFFAARRYAFDYSVTEAVERETGWVFHRIEKDDSSVSVYDLEDLTHQLCYCYSHAGVHERDARDELTSRMKGDLHNIYVPDGVEEQATAAFCDAAPKLLGVRFNNMQESNCEAEKCDCDGGGRNQKGAKNDIITFVGKKIIYTLSTAAACSLPRGCSPLRRIAHRSQNMYAVRSP
jgi:hypothetical protein